MFCNPPLPNPPPQGGRGPRAASVGHAAMAEGAACGGRHLLDGGAALSAAALRLPLRGGEGFAPVRDLQGDGAPTAALHHEPGDDRGVGDGPVARLGPGHARRPLAVGQVRAGDVAHALPPCAGALAPGLRRGPQRAEPAVLSPGQRGADGADGGDRGSCGCEAVLSGLGWWKAPSSGPSGHLLPKGRRASPLIFRETCYIAESSPPAAGLGGPGGLLRISRCAPKAGDSSGTPFGTSLLPSGSAHLIVPPHPSGSPSGEFLMQDVVKEMKLQDLKVKTPT